MIIHDTNDRLGATLEGVGFASSGCLVKRWSGPRGLRPSMATGELGALD